MSIDVFKCYELKISLHYKYIALTSEIYNIFSLGD